MQIFLHLSRSHTHKILSKLFINKQWKMDKPIVFNTNFQMLECLPVSFVIIKKKIFNKTVPGTPFKLQVQPFTATNKGLQTRINNINVVFNFTKATKIGRLEEVINLITFKETNIEQIKNDIKNLNIHGKLEKLHFRIQKTIRKT